VHSDLGCIGPERTDHGTLPARVTAKDVMRVTVFARDDPS
jgi:hypothetical protein